MPADVVRSVPPPPMPGFEPLAVWLEPEWEEGQVGAWVPVLPGAFAHATTPERALTAALSTTGRVREWLEGHGETVRMAPIWRPEVAGVIPCGRDGTHRVQATLPTDERAVTDKDVAATTQRLGWAHGDLLALLARLDEFEGASGALPTDQERGERTVGEVVRHLATAQAWLVGRLPGAGGLPGSLEEPDERALHGATSAWVAERLRMLAANDDGSVTTDRYGERWTLAKVVRRLQAHALDHLWELETRLMRADRTIERLDLVLDRRVSVASELRGLLRAVGWDVRASQTDLMADGIRADDRGRDRVGRRAPRRHRSIDGRRADTMR